MSKCTMAFMNGYQRIQAALQGDSTDTTPVMLHNFMLAAREAGITMRGFRGDPRIIARCFIESVEKYGFDGILLDIDTATLVGAAGAAIEFPEDQPALCHSARLKALAEVNDLLPVDIQTYPRVQIWLEAARRLCRYFGKEIYIRGNCDQCPFSLASMLRSAQAWMLDLIDEDRREGVDNLLEYCAGITFQFIRLMAETGVHMVSNGDSPAGPEMISPAMYRRFALPFEKRVADAAHNLGLPYVLHICGNTNLILNDMVSTGADGLELDYKTDPVLANQAMMGRCTFIGNLDPSGVLASGSSRVVEEKTRELLKCFRGNPRFILNAGCAIPPDTPSDNIRAMIRTARKFSIGD